MTAGDVVRGAMKRYGVKQVEMARIMQISQPALSVKLKRNRITLNDLAIINKRVPFTDDECCLLVRGAKR